MLARYGKLIVRQELLNILIKVMENNVELLLDAIQNLKEVLGNLIILLLYLKKEWLEFKIGSRED